MKKIHRIVIPGGPGLSKQYLKEPLAQAFANESLYFYNPLGSPELPSKARCILNRRSSLLVLTSQQRLWNISQ